MSAVLVATTSMMIVSVLFTIASQPMIFSVMMIEVGSGPSAAAIAAFNCGQFATKILLSNRNLARKLLSV